MTAEANVTIRPAGGVAGIRRGWPRERLALAGIVMAAAATSLLGLRTALLSDSWAHVGSATIRSLGASLSDYLPHLGVWYRPTTNLVYWGVVHAFGVNPLPFHLIAVAAWLVAIVLLYQVALRLTGRPWAAVAGAAAFATSIHAHEPLWDVAALHTAMFVPVVLGMLLAAAGRHWVLAALLAALAMTIEEAGLLCLPLLVLWELVAVPGTGETWRDRIVRTARHATPVAIVTALYVAGRLATGGFQAEGMGSEGVQACHSLSCLVNASVEYTNRMSIRGDVLVNQLWQHSRLIFVGIGILVLVSVAILQPWRWRPLGPLLFALGWMAGTSAFFILGLWPYVADRFLYVPDAGVGLLVAVTVAGSLGLAGGWSSWRRTAAAALGVVGLAWLAVGAFTFIDRAGRWVDAGDEATAIVANLQPYLAAAPPDSLVVVVGVPDLATRQIPPGSNGPFIFHNGLAYAAAVTSGRADLTIADQLVQVPPGQVVTYLQISGTDVSQLPNAPQP